VSTRSGLTCQAFITARISWDGQITGVVHSFFPSTVSSCVAPNMYNISYQEFGSFSSVPVQAMMRTTPNDVDRNIKMTRRNSTNAGHGQLWWHCAIIGGFMGGPLWCVKVSLHIHGIDDVC
jgi:hypothetical protein